MKRISAYLLAILAAAFTACIEDPDIPAPNRGTGTGTVRASANLILPNFNVPERKTRAALSEEDENSWSNVWFAQFLADGSIVAASVAEHPQFDYDFPLENLQSASGTTIWFVANTGANPFLTDPSDAGSLVADVDGFFANVYTPANRNIAEGNRLAMVGKWTGDITAGTTALLKIDVYMARLAAKLDVVVNVEQYNPDNYQNFRMTGEKIQLAAIAKSSTYGTGNKTSADADVYDLAAESLIPNERLTTGSVFVYDSPTYYLLENMHGDRGNATTDGAKNASAPMADGKDIASHIIISANVNDGKNQGTVKYKLYLGGDARRNFDVIRNYHYTLTVTIRGSDITADMRVDDGELYALQIQRLNGRPATSRNQIEESVIDYQALEWGGGKHTANDREHFKMYSKNSTWSFRLNDVSDGVAGEPIATWGELWYTVSTNVTDPPASSWVRVGSQGTGIPNLARFKIVMSNGLYTGLKSRSLMMTFSNDDSPALQRQWKLTQTPVRAFNTPPYVFFEAGGGKFAVPVRAADDAVEWKVTAFSNTTYNPSYTVLDRNGNTVTAGEYVKGNGTVIVTSTAYDPSTVYSTAYRNTTMTISYRTAVPNPIPEDWEDDTETAVVNLRQLPPLSKIEASEYIYQHGYSSSPMFESRMVMNTAIDWAMNLIEEGKNYVDQETLIGAFSTTDGRANTMKVFDAVDRYLYESQPNMPPDVKPAIITPAGLCVMQNADYMNKSAQQLEWYLPSRYEAILEATPSMMGFPSTAAGYTSHLWSSTTQTTAHTEVRYSAHQGMTGADVGGSYSATAATRCIRNVNTPAGGNTYPYITDDGSGNPVIVTAEMVGGVLQGFNEKYTNAIHKPGRPLRFTTPGATGIVGGPGPTMPRDIGTVSPKFQVAKADAPLDAAHAAQLDLNWFQAAGWLEDQSNQASTGCNAYREGDYSDWRIPTEMELRLMGLMGGGVTPNVPALSRGGRSFADAAFGFTPMNAYYWTNREHRDNGEDENGEAIDVYNRARYVIITTGSGGQVAGSAVDKKNTSAGTTLKYRARCVRDIVDPDLVLPKY